MTRKIDCHLCSKQKGSPLSTVIEELKQSSPVWDTKMAWTIKVVFLEIA